MFLLLFSSEFINAHVLVAGDSHTQTLERNSPPTMKLTQSVRLSSSAIYKWRKPASKLQTIVPQKKTNVDEDSNNSLHRKVPGMTYVAGSAHEGAILSSTCRPSTSIYPCPSIPSEHWPKNVLVQHCGSSVKKQDRRRRYTMHTSKLKCPMLTENLHQTRLQRGSQQQHHHEQYQQKLSGLQSGITRIVQGSRDLSITGLRTGM